MSDDSISQRTEYIFGPFCLHLMPGWSGSFEEGVHTLASDETDAAIQISGFERDAPVELSELYAQVPEGSEGLTRFSLVSGFDGYGWIDPESGDGHRMIRSDSIVLAVRVLYPADASDSDHEVVDAMIGTLARN